MNVTEELLTAGASHRGGHSRQQLELLGVEWPLKKGWKHAILGKSISDEAANEFVRLAGHHIESKNGKSCVPVNWCGAQKPIDIHLYVLALADGCFYVGLTSDVDRRIEQHNAGKGADWTRLHVPLSLLHTVNTGTRDGRQAEEMEDEVTIALMLRHGLEKARGGHFSSVDQAQIEDLLRGHGLWDRVKQAGVAHHAFDTEASWSDALDHFLQVALNYYDTGSPADEHNTMFEAVYRLTRYRYWQDEFLPGLSWQFWNKKGVLPVLLSFKLKRPVASRLSLTYDVLAAAMNRGRAGQHPLRRLFLLAWQAYCPPATDSQAMAVEKYIACLGDPTEYDRQYDQFVSVLFPETRSLLRSKHS